MAKSTKCDLKHSVCYFDNRLRH